MIPFLLAKLWSVIPRLFAWPPVTSPAQAIERLSIALLVSSAVFQLATGVANAQYWYPFKFNFVVAHYYGAIVFVASLALHVIVKLPVILRAYRERGVLKPLREDLANTKPEPDEHGGLVATEPGGADDLAPRPVRLRRRGRAHAAARPTSASRSAARCASWRSSRRAATSDFPVNKTRRAPPGSRPAMTGAGLPARAARRRTEVVAFTREDLLALPQHTATLPIACVEGWIDDAGVDRRAAVGAGRARGRAGREPGARRVAAAEGRAAPRVADRRPDRRRRLDAGAEGQRRGPLAGPRLSRRAIIVPALPGVHNTKWVGEMTFQRMRPLRRLAGPPAGAPDPAAARRLGAADRARLPRGVERRRCGWSAP